MKLVLIGYGKMGKALATLATQRGHEIVQMIDSSNRGLLANLSTRAVDVALEFSGPTVAYEHIFQCLRQGIPVISGTTGWLKDRKAIEQFCMEQSGTFFYASNFSIGANIFFKLNQFLAQLMSQQMAYQVSIEEVHHTTKKDAPSGTAMSLAEAIVQHIPSQRWHQVDGQEADKLPIISQRLPDVTGIHRVTYTSLLDTLAIQHTAHSRACFALGAILVAEWLHSQGKKGLLGMDDFLSWAP